ncbi:hypothetical protein ENBRE01_1634 [Enteropsectra breve]|nr:hypothetical protein ENBRE01_1634 [Enteropsectra breve]
MASMLHCAFAMLSYKYGNDSAAVRNTLRAYLEADSIKQVFCSSYIEVQKQQTTNAIVDLVFVSAADADLDSYKQQICASLLANASKMTAYSRFITDDEKIQLLNALFYYWSSTKRCTNSYRSLI